MMRYCSLNQRITRIWLLSGRVRAARASVRLLAIGLALWFSATAYAIVVNQNVQGTLMNPGSYIGWNQGDPGWDNVSQGGTNFVYLGNSWILTARHVANPTPTTPITATFSTGSFQSIPNQSYIVSNPPPALAAGLDLTAETDLRLIRINGDPGLPSLTIATQTPPSAGSGGSQVVFVGNGRLQQPAQTHWQVNTSNPDNWVWTEVAVGGNFHGYETDATFVKRWGTNRLANAQSSDYSEVFSSTINSRTAILPLKTGDGVTRDVITMLSTFDNGGSDFEAQAAPSDSGGAVFYKNGAKWQLAGIINSTFLYPNQPASTAVFGDATTFANLWYYNQNYTGSISQIIGSQVGYSIMGDVNLDGVVSGNGTGPASSDDITAFVNGWSYEQAIGDINSWKKGDLNLDGRTDVADFLLFRGTVAGTASGTALSKLLHVSTGVPEPGAAVLIVAGLLGLASWARPRRRLDRTLSTTD